MLFAQTPAFPTLLLLLLLCHRLSTSASSKPLVILRYNMHLLSLADWTVKSDSGTMSSLTGAA
jgi:hypothetical protein